MASGRPVIAFKQGGALDTVIEDQSGIFFDKQTPLHLKAAIEEYQQKKKQFKPELIQKHAQQFDKKEFEKKLMKYLREKWEHWQQINR